MRADIDFKNYTDSDYEALCFFSIWNSMRGLASERSIITYFIFGRMASEEIHDKNRDKKAAPASDIR